MGRLEDRLKADKQEKIEEKKFIATEITDETPGPVGVITDIKDKPVPKGLIKHDICGEPIDWHDLEDFVVNIEPKKFVTLLKLKDVILREKMMRYAKKPGSSGKWLWIILIAIILLVGGIVAIMFGPQIMSMLSGTKEAVTGG